jgi:HAD superfamily hydrolase (TIGR01509 family)
MGSDSTLVVFDLDDTLIDTRNVLLPAALGRVAAATGIPVDRLDPRGKKIEEVLAGIEGLTAAQREAAAKAWYLPDVPPLEPLPGARELVRSLRGRVRLVLLTRGAPARQERKIAQCGLGPLFDEIVIRAIEAPGSKRDDLEALLRRHGVPPARCAVIGDDDRDELRHARDLGCVAIKVPETPLAGIPAALRRAGILG